MAIEKSVYQAPMGLASLPEEPIEIEIEDPEAVSISMDGLEITLEKGSDFEGADFNSNLAEVLDEGVLNTIASELTELVEADIDSRKDWAETFVKGLEVLGLQYEERTEPWNGACGVYSTVLTEAAIRFQSESIMETFPAGGPVKTEIIGAITKQKEEASERVRTDMNYTLTEKMTDYRPEHERLLYSLGLAGAAFKKVYPDTQKQIPAAPFIPAEDIIVPYGTSSLKNAERVTHVMRKTKNEIKKLQYSGFYRDVDLGEPMNILSDIEKKKAEQQGYKTNDDDRYRILEIHTYLDIEGLEDVDEDGEHTGIALPYVVTIDQGTNQVLSVYRNWNEDDPNKQSRQHFVDYCYIPGFGFYGLGLIHIIGGYARAGTSLIRQLVDAGTLSNLPGGLKTRGMRIKDDDTPIAPGEWRDIDIPSGAMRDNIMPLPYKEPSQVLLTLLNQITEEGRRLGSIGEMKISDMSANAPVGTTLALLERQLKMMSAVQARVHASMKQEFKLLKEIIRDYAPTEYEYDPESGDRMAKQSDYDIVEVIPVSDPNSSTMAQRIMQYQAVIQLATTAPQIYDLPNLHRQMIEVLGIKNAEKLVPVEDDQKPKDPISENMAFLNGKPTKAFIYQDHEAHIAAHMAFMQDPMIAQVIGQNPMAQKIQMAAMAHIAEHLAFSYRKKVEEQVGVPIPAPDAQLPEDVEVQLSRLVAQGAQQLLQLNQAQAQQAQAQQQMQDPLVQIQQAELQIDAQKAQSDAQVAQAKLQLEAQRIANQKEVDLARIASQEKLANQKVQVDLFKRSNK
ncbi:hypothetical protein EBT31_06800 [bacterium]|jgi:hypothetical protein|nr:hypothetical protein [bacterium]